MDFIDKLRNEINKTIKPKPKLRKGFLGKDDSLVVFPLAGSKVTKEYYDGVKEQELNYEIAMKSKNADLLDKTLWDIQSFLENLTVLESDDDSFDFNGIEITNKPFIQMFDEKGWFIFLVDFKANITIY